MWTTRSERYKRLILNVDWVDEVFNRSEAEDAVNAAPGSFRPLLHLDEGALFVDAVHWGYRSTWAEVSDRVPMAIHTRLDEITNRYWNPHPIVLNAADAAMWMNPDLSADAGVHILKNLAVPAEAFAWYMVNNAIDNVRNQDRQLAESIPSLTGCWSPPARCASGQAVNSDCRQTRPGGLLGAFAGPG